MIKMGMMVVTVVMVMITAMKQKLVKAFHDNGENDGDNVMMVVIC